ncbi:hypothetical protein Ddye_008959, partial [Dipteronia dyeriana]
MNKLYGFHRYRLTISIVYYLRCVVQVQLTDSYGVLPATIFGENTEKFLGCSSKQLMENTSE